MDHMFTICIPNYNYAHYLPKTFDSVFAQHHNDFEVVVADNQSTDDSVAVIQRYAEQFPGKVRYQENPSNLGFAGNLDQVGRMVNTPYMLMLSSDDLMKPEALSTYQTLVSKLPSEERWVVTSAKDVIDGEDRLLETELRENMHKRLWLPEDKDEALSAAINAPVYKVASAEMLKRCFQQMANPFNFLCTAFPTELYQKVGGYGGGRLINPDKWFHWKITAAADFVYFVDLPLFQYRWHANNQTAQQANSGHLKYLVDEYRATIETSQAMLDKAGISAKELQNYFVKEDIVRHGLGELRRGLWLKSWRILHFGLGVYPGRVVRDMAFIPYLFLLFLGPIGMGILKLKKR